MNRVPAILSSLLLAYLLLLPWNVQALIEATEGACTRTSAAIDVRVQGVRSDRGNIMFVLYGDNPDDFLVKGKRIFKQQFAAKRGTVAFCVIVQKAGAYAASVYHDENGNKKFDRNWIGIPAEGAGFSNNPTLLLGPPSHAQAAFQVSNGPKRVEIQLNYSIVSGRQSPNLP
ncbi:MAG: DUF2141 domain-containing protein [Candidatus Methylomirabilis oxygeniifera]|uniref:DUF2141 domain-containing protein n=1 Tax=Methylomirabilis oxygeniifera TaxID=671143 RepID=D5MMM7_METO1|nr:MAG: DUF2141 domain-containing protein [Candidatus Methylomirabilis oxyfera]CBE70149.1 conserved exported protein of unknown function [Candidatus Methylomirabilis oxyfera]